MPSNTTPTDRTRAARLKKAWDARARKLSLTQAKAAERLKITQGQVSHYLLGRVPLNAKVIAGFAGMLGIDPHTIEAEWDYTPELPPGLTPEGYEMALAWQRLPPVAREDFSRLIRTLGQKPTYTAFVEKAAPRPKVA